MAKTFIQNICGTIAKSDLAKISNSNSINMFQETQNVNQDYVSMVMRSIPGMKTMIEMNGEPRGIFTVSRGYNEKPTTYAVFGYKLYMIVNNTPYEIGTMAQTSNICHFCETGGYAPAHPHLIITDGVNVYAVNTGLNIGDQIADFRTIKLPLREESTNEYIQPTHCAYLYSYLIVNDATTDTMYVSYYRPFVKVDEEGKHDYNLFEVSEEGGHSQRYFRANYQPDETVAICSNGSRLLVLGDKSYQLFQYTGDTNMPFTSPDTAAKLIGIKARDSLAQLGELTFWLGSADMGNNGVYLNTGAVECQRISTPDIEREFATFSNVIDAYGQVWQENQHIFYAITFPTAHRTFVYDMAEKAWHERCSLNNKNQRKEWRYRFASLDPNGNRLFVTKNAIVTYDTKNWKEHDGTPMLRLRTGGVIYNNYSNFYIDALTIEMNNGQSAYYLEDEAKLSMRYTADGSQWSDTEIVGVGHAGDYDYDCTFYSFGMAKCFSIEISTTDNFPFALYGLKLTTQECKW